MTNEQFLNQFGHFVDAPNGLQMLRELILQLAVQGKLVPQDSDDEPASVLLEKIKAEKERLVKEGKIKSRKLLAVKSVDRFQHSIPDGWLVEQISNLILNDVGGGTPSKQIATYWGGDIPWASVKDIGKSKYLRTTVDSITQLGLEKSSSNLIPKGQIILCTRMGLGKLSINEIDVAINQDLRALNIPPMLNINYLYNFFLTQDIKGSGMTVKGIKRGELLQMLCPLPPLAEQSRIVAKVDELVTLCDQLEAEHKACNETHTSLIRAVHHHLTEAGDTTATQTAWLRIRDNFNGLYTTTDAVQALRQSILQLAVQGKLVSQDPNDEPASVLLERIKDEREKQQKAERIKFPVVKVIELVDEPYLKPSNWSWARLGQIIKISSGNGLTAKNMADNGTIPVYGGNGVNGYHDKYNIKKPTLVIGRVGFYCGSIHLTPEKAWVTDNAFITKYSTENINQDFLYWLLKGTNLKEKDSATAQPVISGRKVYPIIIGLPPLAEQRRIVAKVDELMVLCGQLETQINNKSTTASRYAEAIVQQIAAA